MIQSAIVGRAKGETSTAITRNAIAPVVSPAIKAATAIMLTITLITPHPAPRMQSRNVMMDVITESKSRSGKSSVRNMNLIKKTSFYQGFTVAHYNCTSAKRVRQGCGKR